MSYRYTHKNILLGVEMIMRTTKVLVCATICATSLFSAGMDLKNKGVSIEYKDAFDEAKSVVIKRMHDATCKKVDGTSPSVIWGGDYANKSVVENCKKTFVTTVGKISPIKIAKGIDTYGELEVIEFIKKATKDENLMLIDARLANWYELGTIPSSTNISYKRFDKKKYPTEFEDTLETVGVEIVDGKYNFKEAKTLLLFCNGIWCPQSSWAIENLLKIGYPEEKLKWYRGGLYSWRMLNLTTVKP